MSDVEGGRPYGYYSNVVDTEDPQPFFELLILMEVQLVTPVAQLISRPCVRVICDVCGEEVINEREVFALDRTLCRACAGRAYYQIPVPLSCLSLPEPAC